MSNAQSRQIGLRRTLLSVGLAAAFGASDAAGAVRTVHNNHGVLPSWRGTQSAWTTGTGHTAERRQKITQARARAATRGSDPTVVVTSCADAGQGTLRQAAIDAVTDTTIDMSALTCSTISLTSGAIDFTVDGVTLLGPGQDALTIDGQGSDRVLTSTYGLGVKYLTIANGYANGAGGCIQANTYVVLGHSTVTGCQVVGNAGGTDPYVGGGVASFGDVIMGYSSVSGNTVVTTGTTDAYGGGVYAANDAVVLYASSVDDNTVTTVDGNAGGGGIFTADDAIVYYSSQVSGNSVVSTNGAVYGGGIELKYETPPVAQGAANGLPRVVIHAVTVNSSSISGNSVHSETKWSYGGGIHAYAGDIYLQHATISGNTASSNCSFCANRGGGASVVYGGIFSYYSTLSDNALLVPDSISAGGGLASYSGSSPVVLINSTVSGNKVVGAEAYAYGGGIVVYSTAIYSYNSTVASNSSSGSGGGIYFMTPQIVFMPVTLGGVNSQLVSTIVADNEAPTAPGIGAAAPMNLDGDHNLVESAGVNVTLPMDTLSIDPVLQPLRSNGGPTATHALLVCSPAIDNGSNPLAYFWDQRGEPFSRSWAADQDIGAFELQPNADIIFRNGFDPDQCSPP